MSIMTRGRSGGGRSGRWGREAGLVGIPHRLSTVAGPDLGEDPVDMRLDRGIRQYELRTDLGVGETGGNQREHLGLASGQTLDVWGARRGRLGDHRGDQLLLYGRVEVGLPGVDGPDRGFDLLGAGVLGEISGL